MGGTISIYLKLTSRVQHVMCVCDAPTKCRLFSVYLGLRGAVALPFLDHLLFVLLLAVAAAAAAAVVVVVVVVVVVLLLLLLLLLHLHLGR